MAGEADYGLFLWNGKSRGTLNSIRMLLKRGRPVLVYVSPKRTFVTIKEERDLDGELGKFSPAVPLPQGRSAKKRTRPTAQRSLFG